MVSYGIALLEAFNSFCISADVYHSTNFLAASLFSENFVTPFPNGIPAYYAEMSSAMYNAINKMALGEMTAEEAFEDMNAKITELVEQE